MRRYAFQLDSVDLTEKELASHDLVLLATDHDRFDYDAIESHAQLIVDTRGRYLGVRGNVVKA
jgi:UDP-N-acetyl-D-glucosamine dehydrogenase